MRKKGTDKSGVIYEIHNFLCDGDCFCGRMPGDYVAVEAEKAGLSDAEYREVIKAERLGEELYLQDVIAAKATHMLLQTVGPIKPGELSGWIVVKEGAKT